MPGLRKWRKPASYKRKALSVLALTFLILLSTAFTPLSHAWSDNDWEESLFDTEIGEKTEMRVLDDDPEEKLDGEGVENKENPVIQDCPECFSAYHESDDFAEMETLPNPAEVDGEADLTVLTNSEKRFLSPPEEDIMEEETVTGPDLDLVHAAEIGLSETEEDLEKEVPLRSSAKSTTTVTRYIYRVHISAEDLEYTAAHHAEYAIVDQNDNTVTTLTLSDDNLWKADWELIAEAGSFSVKELGIYDSTGNNITGNWTSEPQASERSDEYNYSGWAVTDTMDSVGSYVIEYESGGQKYLLAVRNSNSDHLSSGYVYYWELTGEQNTPENASNAAVWNVTATYTAGIRIKNVALNDKDAFLTTRKINKKYTFAMIKDLSSNLSQFENHRLKTSDNVYLRATSWEISSVSSADEATELTIYHPVTYHDIIYKKSVSFYHTSLPPPVQNVDMTVRLLVNGNMGERDREFPFIASVNDGNDISFSLKHGGEYVLSNIPVGARLTVRIEPSGHTITSSFSGGEEGETILTVPCVPRESGTVVFFAVREAELDTGITSDTGLPYIIFLIALFSYIALEPIIKVNAQNNFILSTGGKRP